VRKKRTYKTFNREFKLEADRMMDGEDHQTAKNARELGFRRNQVYKWKEQLAKKSDEAFTRTAGRPTWETVCDAICRSIW